jgi:predicted kinase
MPRCYQLIGVPGSGKSTWVANQNWTGACVIVSTDAHVEAYAAEQGKTYNEVFRDYMKTATALMTEDVHRAREAGQDVIWDQTSMSVKSRRNKFRMLPNYEHIAVVFRTPDREEHARRLANRPGKLIPESVIASMIANYEEPSEEEGFSEIWFAA